MSDKMRQNFGSDLFTQIMEGLSLGVEVLGWHAYGFECPGGCEAARRVLRAVREHGSMSKRDLQRHQQWLTAESRDAILPALVAEGLVAINGNEVTALPFADYLRHILRRSFGEMPEPMWKGSAPSWNRPPESFSNQHEYTHIMTIIDDTKVEEVYLTDEQVSHWLGTDTDRADRFEREGKPVVLGNLDPNANPDLLPPPRNELRALVHRAMGPAYLFHQHCGFRKLTRSTGAAWTVFLHSDTVIGIHDDGTVIARHLSIYEAHEFRITTGGDFLCNGRVQQEADLKTLDVVARFAAIRDGVSVWRCRDARRKMPQGLRRLCKRVAKAGEVNLL
jgi:hypothetical protein